MPRLTTLVLAGALGWPAVTFGQVSSPWQAPPKPAPAAGRPTAPGSPVMAAPVAQPVVETAPADAKPADAKTEEVVVPALPKSGPLPDSLKAAMPPTVVKAQRTEPELPRPTPAPTAPDVSGMPPARTAPNGYNGGVPHHGGPIHNGPGMLPGTMAPHIPALCVPPEPEFCGSCNASGCFIFGDVMMLRARQSTPVAVLQSVNNAVPQVTTTELVQYNTDHTWAYRVGGGVLCDDGWIFQATYTQFKDLVSTQTFVVPDLSPDATFSVTFTGPGQLTGTQISDVGSVLTADWNIQLHTVDVVFGTVFTPAECLDVTVSAGGRLAFFDQDYRAAISSINGTNAQDLSTDLRGAGPIIVSEARVHVKQGCSIYGRGLTGLLLANREDVSTTTNSDFAGAVLAVRRANYDREEIVPLVELAFGLEFCCCDGRIAVNSGYEFMYWYELGTSYSELADSQRRVPTYGDISFDGWYLRVTLLF